MCARTINLNFHIAAHYAHRKQLANGVGMDQQERMARIAAARDRLNSMKTSSGGYTKATLQSLGVSWPPQHGWKRRLIAQMAGIDASQNERPAPPKPERSGYVEKIMNTADCPTCGATAGSPCTKNGKERTKNHHERLVLAQSMMTAERKGSKATPKAKGKKKAPKTTPIGGRNGSASFYSSWEWKRVRYEALKLHGHRCQCCGWQPGDTKHGWLVVDHIKPRSKYPELQLELTNMQVTCNDCNLGKSNVYEDDFRRADSWLASIANEE